MGKKKEEEIIDALKNIDRIIDMKITQFNNSNFNI